MQLKKITSTITSHFSPKRAAFTIHREMNV